MNDIISTGLCELPDACLAYVGPGSGVTMLWALLAVLGGILFMVVGLLLWPVRVLLRSIKKNKTKNAGGNSPSTNAEATEAAGDDKQTLPSS